jgi:Domain of unknown function (DUF6285)
MHDRPNPDEIVAAVRDYLERELIPTLADPRLRFQTLVAANVLGIVERQLQGEEAQLLAEATMLPTAGAVPQRLSELRQAVRAGNQRLCEQIRNGDFDEPEHFRALSLQLRQPVIEKLKVANPRYLAGVM